MKPKEYISKYNLQSGWNSKVQDDFLKDLSSEFLAFCEYYKVENNIRGFDLTVKTIRDKWNGISNKIPYGLPEKLWSYFYASFIVKLRDEMYPEEMERRREEKRIRDEYREERRKEREYFENLRQRKIYEDWYVYYYAAMLLFGDIKTRPIDAYEILGLKEDATEEDVKIRYRELSMKHHPDKGGKQEDFVKITEAKNKVLAYICKK